MKMNLRIAVVLLLVPMISAQFWGSPMGYGGLGGGPYYQSVSSSPLGFSAVRSGPFGSSTTSWNPITGFAKVATNPWGGYRSVAAGPLGYSSYSNFGRR